MKEALDNGLKIPVPPPLAQAITQPPPLPTSLIDASLEEIYEVDEFDEPVDDDYENIELIIEDDDEDDDEFSELTK